MRKSFIFCISILFLLPSIALASPKANEWKKPSYAFSNIKKAILVQPFNAGEMGDPFALEKGREYVDEFLNSKDNKSEIVIIPLEKAKEEIRFVEGSCALDDTSLEFKEQLRLFIDQAKKLYDSIIFISLACDYSQSYKSPMSIPYTTYNMATFYTSNGSSGYVNVPQQNSINIPGHYVTYANGSCYMEINDLNTMERIYGVVVSDSERKSKLNNTNATFVMKKTIKVAIKKFSDLTKK